MRGALIALGVVLLVALGALGIGVWQQWRTARERGVEPGLVGLRIVVALVDITLLLASALLPLLIEIMR